MKIKMALLLLSTVGIAYGMQGSKEKTVVANTKTMPMDVRPSISKQTPEYCIKIKQKETNINEDLTYAMLQFDDLAIGNEVEDFLPSPFNGSTSKKAAKNSTEPSPSVSAKSLVTIPGVLTRYKHPRHEN